MIPAFSHLRISRTFRLSPIRMFDELYQPVTIDIVKEAFDVGVQYPVHSLFGDRHVQRIKGLMLATLRPEAVAESNEVFLVDTLDHRANRVLDDLVFDRPDSQRTLSSVSLFNVDPFGRRRPKGSAVNATVKIGDAIFQALLIFMPRDPIHTDGCRLLELIKARRQQFDVDVVKQGGEFELTATSSRLAHTVQSA